MIEISHVSKVYTSRKGADIVALDDVSLSVPQGSIFGVIGESGAGKSTLIRCVNALERPSRGSITVDGQDITKLNPARLRAARQGMGMIFQGFNLLSSRTVGGNVSLPLEVMKLSSSERKRRVQELLGLVGLAHREDAWPSQLSGGQKQRVGIARALAGYPQVLLSDESTSALDPQTTASILALMKRLNEQLGLTILLITHEMDVVKRICSHTAVIEDGRIIEQGATRDLMLTPSSHIAQAVFPQANHADQTGSGTRVIVPVSRRETLPRLLIGLQHSYTVIPTVLSGSIEQIGEDHLGQFTLDLEGDGAPEAASWLTREWHAQVVTR